MHQAGNETGELSIDILAMLGRRKGLILASGILGLLAGACYFLLLPPSFESSAQILLMKNDSASMASRLSSNESAISEDLLATHMSLLQSRRIVRSALEGHDLDQLPSIQAQLSGEMEPADYVIENLYVTRGGEGAARDARIVSFAFRHTNPEDAKLVAEAVLEEYRSFVQSKFQDINKEAVALIDTARKELDLEIEEINDQYQNFRSESPLLATTQGGANVYALRYEELSADLSDLLVLIDESQGRLDLVKSQLVRLEDSDAHDLQKLALIDERNAERLGILVTVERGEAQTAAFQALQPERMAGAQTEYSSLLAAKAALRRAMDDYGPKHPEVVTLQTQVAEMEEFFESREVKLGVGDDEVPLKPDDVMNAYVSLLENDVRALEQRKSDLEQQILDAEEKAKELVAFELQNEELLREMARHEELYGSVVERLRDINMQQDSSALIQEVVDEPALGEQVSPRPSIAAAIAILATLVLAGSSVLVAELTDKSIHTNEDLESIFQSSIIGHIPDFKKDAETRLLMKRVAKTNQDVDPTVITFHDSKSRISEAFRGARTQVLFGLGGTHKIVAVTSPDQGEGKSTVTANLAVSLAKSGKSTLLIDCDLRRPAVQSLFHINQGSGLSQVLSEESDLTDCFREGPCENLTIVLAGGTPENPAELLSSDRLDDLLRVLREKFDYVLLDCPPLLPVADTSILIPSVDQVVLVTDLSSGDELPKSKRSQRIIESVEGRLAGIVVNRDSGKTKRYYYGDYEAEQYRAQAST